METAQLLSMTTSVVDTLEERSERFQAKFFMVEEEPVITSMSLQIVNEEVIYDLFGFLVVLFYGMQERLSLMINARYPAKLLKNTNQKGIYSLDHLHQLLADYRHIKCVIFNQYRISISFVSCLNLSVLRQLLVDFATEQKGSLDLCGKKNGNCLQLNLGGATVIEIRDMNINIFYQDCGSAEELYQRIQIVVELIAYIEKELLFLNSPLIQLGTFQPFIELSAPQLFDRVFLQNLMALCEQLNKGIIPDVLRQTRKSQLYHQADGDLRYLLDKQYYDEHIEYVIYLPTERSLLIKFSLHLDISRINALLANKKITSSEQKTKKQDNFIIKKGGSSRLVRKNFSIYNQLCYDQDKLVCTICGRNIIKLPLDNIENGLAIFADIYYQRLLISSWLPTAQLPCDLSDYERQVIKNMENLFNIYNFFIRPIFGKELKEVAYRTVYENSQEVLPEVLKADKWIYQQLMLINEDDYFEKFHTLLLHIKEMVDQQMPEMIRQSSFSASRAFELQEILIKMIGVSQAFINGYKPQALLA